MFFSVLGGGFVRKQRVWWVSVERSSGHCRSGAGGKELYASAGSHGSQRQRPIAPGPESLSSLQENESHQGLQSDLVEKVSERSGAFCFLLRPGGIIDAFSFSFAV
jgi:hypothetical protein